MSLLARHLEANGIPTLIIGSAIDIVRHCGVPRYLHTDFPLGNPCGEPYNREMQRSVIEQALSVFETADEANTIMRSPFEWQHSAWVDDYSKVDDSNREALRLKGEARRAQQKTHKVVGNTRAAMISET